MGSWSKVEPVNIVYSYKLDPGPTSPEVCAGANLSAVDLFNRFFTPEVWELLVVETNRKAALCPMSTPHSRHWHDSTVSEMKAFIGILITMGILKLPRLELYWQVKHRTIRSPGVSEIMPRNRFEQLFRFLHLNDSSLQHPVGHPQYCRLFKVRKLLDLVEPRFDQEYHMHQQCTIDEAMIPFKGRLGFKQYMKDKPTKWGIKVWVLADATNGYVKRIQVYTGKGDGDNGVGLCSRVVLELVNGLETSGLQLYTDNYYTSPVLFQHLYNNGMNACGTARANRLFFPQELIIAATKTNRGFSDFRSNGPLLAAVWVDKRAIYFVSTFHPAESPAGMPPSIVKRRTLDGTQKDIPCPPILPDYQSFMRGVDRGDQLQTYYSIGRRSRKWWRRVFFYIVEVAILNAYILDGHVRPATHAYVGRRKRDMLEFRLDLVDELIDGFCSRKRLGRPRGWAQAQRDRLNATIEHYPDVVDLRARCVVCMAKGQRHESVVQCSHCEVSLCVARSRPCFRKFHTLSDYTN